MLIEPSYKINGEDKTKNQARSSRANGEEDSKATAKPVPDNKVDAKGETTLSPDSKLRSTASPDLKTKETQASDAKADSETKEDHKTASKSSSDSKPNSSTKTAPKTDNKSVEEIADNSSKRDPLKLGQESVSSLSESGVRRSDIGASTSPSKQDVRQPIAQTPAPKSSLEENIVLGVALEGSKRTLPIEEEMVAPSNPEDMKELAKTRSGNGPAVAEKEKNDIKRSNGPGSPSNDQADQ